MKMQGQFNPERLVFGMLLALATSAPAALVNHWSFEEGTGSTTADIVGGQTGTLTNMAPASDWVASGAPVPSGTTWALDFDGSNDQVRAIGYTGITGTANRSMSAWVNTTDQTATIMSWGTNTGSQKWTYRLQNSNGTNGATRIEVNGGYKVGTTPIDDGSWHHVALTWENDGSPNVRDARLWVDGELEGTSADQGQSVNTASVDPVRIGTSVAGDTKWYDGQIDDVRIYDHAMTRNQVRALAGQAPDATADDAYSQAVKIDGPVAYWRLSDGGSGALNEGSTGGAADGTYAGGVAVNAPGLLSTTPNTAADFDGVDGRVQVPDHAEINDTGSTDAFHKSFEAWFRSDGGTGRDVIYEQGGGTNGFNVYTQEDAGNLYLRYGAWEPGTNHFPARVEIQEGEVYHAVSVFDAPDDTMLLYVNGARVSGKNNNNVTSIPSQTGDIGIGRMQNDTRFDNATDSGAGDEFDGTIDEMALYNTSLTARQIQTHYVVGSGDRLGITPGATLGVALNFDAANDTDAATIEDSIGTRPNNANIDQFELSTSSAVSLVDTASRRLKQVSRAYQFDGSGGATGQNWESVAGNPSDEDASVELVFKPSDFSGREMLLDVGGTTDGLSFILDGSTLEFNVKDGGQNARAYFDLLSLPPDVHNDFFDVVGVADLANDEALLYINGLLGDMVSATGNIADWSGSNNVGLGVQNDQGAFSGGAGPFSGQIALARFYPSVLSSADIWANFQALLPEPSASPVFLVGLLALALRRRRA